MANTRLPKTTSKFCQQKLPAWQPIINIRSVLKFIVPLSIIFTLIGTILTVTNSQLVEFSIDYTTACKIAIASRGNSNQSESCFVRLQKEPLHSPHRNCVCTVDFRIPRNISGPIYVYYALSNFYQNHRYYMLSRDDKQLAALDSNNNGAIRGGGSDEGGGGGQLLTFLNESRSLKNESDLLTVSASCMNPSVSTSASSSATSSRHRRLIAAPCGQMANSIFNDTFELFRLEQNINNNDDAYKNNNNNNNNAKNNKSRRVPINMTGQNIAWSSDVLYRFGKPKDWSNTGKPPNWPQSALDRSPNAYSGDEELIVWMRPATLSSFRKLHRVLHADLSVGAYRMLIHYAYPVHAFHGRKLFILSQSNKLGGRNAFIGILYLFSGVLFAVISSVFLYTDRKHANKLKQSSSIPLLKTSATATTMNLAGGNNKEDGHSTEIVS